VGIKSAKFSQRLHVPETIPFSVSNMLLPIVHLAGVGSHRFSMPKIAQLTHLSTVLEGRQSNSQKLFSVLVHA